MLWYFADRRPERKLNSVLYLFRNCFTSHGFYRSPAVALMPDLTPKPLRSKANAIINLMGTLGAVYTLGIVILLVNDEEVKKMVTQKFS